ncbi:hypothetical protein LCGC14_0445250 [marine sediment metagenome]|uniref:Uncharacterized protein n=1 Tax=marine sediment metagenome TaxID=412755 RepID=A0A0F9VTG8_9ZZZZ
MLARLRRAWGAFWAEPLREPFRLPVRTLIAYPELCRTPAGQWILDDLKSREREVVTGVDGVRQEPDA